MDSREVLTRLFYQEGKRVRNVYGMTSIAYLEEGPEQRDEVLLLEIHPRARFRCLELWVSEAEAIGHDGSPIFGIYASQLNPCGEFQFSIEFLGENQIVGDEFLLGLVGRLKHGKETLTTPSLFDNTLAEDPDLPEVPWVYNTKVANG